MFLREAGVDFPNRRCSPPCSHRHTKRKATVPPEAPSGDNKRLVINGLGYLTLWFSDEAIAGWRAAPRTIRGGQPWYSPLAILTALTLRTVFRLALCQTEGLIGSIVSLLGLSLAVSTYATLSRRAKTVDVPRPCAGSGADSEPVYLLVGSTGLKLCGAGEWLVETHGTRRRRSRRKLHIGVDASTGEMVAAPLTTKDVDDVSEVGSLLKQVEDPVASFTADGAYDQDSLYR
ncbi:MAG: IS5 family transposase [Rhodopila sp.]